MFLFTSLTLTNRRRKYALTVQLLQYIQTRDNTYTIEQGKPTKTKLSSNYS